MATEAETTIIRRLDYLQPSFETKLRRMINDCAYEGIHLCVNETLRLYARQNYLYAQGRTLPGSIVTNARAGQGEHGFGLAADIVPTIGNVKGGQPDWNFGIHSPRWKRVVQIAKLNGIAWGGDWRKFKDLPHFQDAKAPPLWMLRLKYPHGYIPKGMAA